MDLSTVGLCGSDMLDIVHVVLIICCMCFPHLFFPASVDMSGLSTSIVDLVENSLNGTNYHFIVNCAFRDPEEDRRKGRSGTSYHCKGRALDLSTSGLSGSDRRNIVLRFMKAGLTVGLYKTFIHVDNRDNPILFYGE